MAVECFGGAIVGAAFGELVAEVKEAVTTIDDFKPGLKSLSKTLSNIQPIVDEIVRLDGELGRIPRNSNLSDLLKRGKELVKECSNVRWWNSQYNYSKKLKELDDSLVRFFQVDEQAQISRDNREILRLVKQIHTYLRIGGVSNRCKRSYSIPKPPKYVVGFEEPLEELKKKVLEDDDDASVVVISALGGQGKTTLAKMLCHDQQIRDTFDDNIFFVTVTEKPDLRHVVHRLITDMGYLEPSEVQTEEDAINELEKSVRQIGADRFLLVLDDVWSGSEWLVQKFEFPIKGFKILVTSRSRFRKYSRNTYELGPLDEQNAMELFCRFAFPRGENPDMPAKLVNKIVKSCQGFPLALEVLGSSLSQLPVEMWTEGSKCVSSDKLLGCLQRSVDTLDKLSNYIKDCYLDLGLFPEDERIPVSSLSDMWAELYNIDLGKTLLNLNELSTRNLAELISVRKDNDTSEIEVSSDEHYVMQHDKLRELAIRLSSQEPIQQRARLNIDISRDNLSDFPVEEPLNARILSFSADETLSSNHQVPSHGKANRQVPRHGKAYFVWWLVSIIFTIFQSVGSFLKQKYLGLFHPKQRKFCSLKLPKVEALLVNIRSRNYTFPQFMKEMGNLKVLIVTNYGYHPTELQSFRLPCALLSLRRIRLVHVSISAFDTSILKMKNLQKISFSMCKNVEAFGKDARKISIKLPKLIEIEIDRCYDLTTLPSGLCDLPQLTKLRITNCHELIELPEELGKLSNLEVLMLGSCTKLSRLPESIGELHKLRFLDISECIAIKVLPERMGELRGLVKVNMRGCTGILELPESFMELCLLKEVICDEETSSVWNNFDSDITDREIKVVKRENSLKWLH